MLATVKNTAMLLLPQDQRAAVTEVQGDTPETLMAQHTGRRAGRVPELVLGVGYSFGDWEVGRLPGWALQTHTPTCTFLGLNTRHKRGSQSLWCHAGWDPQCKPEGSPRLLCLCGLAESGLPLLSCVPAGLGLEVLCLLWASCL